MQCCGGQQHHRNLCELSKGDKNLTLSCRKGNRWCKHSHTHKFTLFHNTRLLPCLSSEGLWLELVILDSALKLPGKGLQQVEQGMDEPRLGLTNHTQILCTQTLHTSASLQLTEHFHAHLQSSYRPHGSPCWLQHGPTHTQTTAQHPLMLYLRTCMQTVL